MSTATLTRTANMLTVAVPADPTQEQWEKAMDWVNANARPGAEGTFIDLGEQHVWLFPAAA